VSSLKPQSLSSFRARKRADKIVAKKIPSRAVYETPTVYAFHDISPTAPVHIIIVPKHRDGLSQLQFAEPRHTEILGQLLLAAAEIAKQEGLQDGFRIVINDGKLGCQSVNHLHLHLIGGKQLSWPPGTGAPEGSMKG